MAKKLSRTKSQKVAYWVVLVSFAAPLIYYLVQLIVGTFDTMNLLTMLQCALGLIVLHVPDFLSEKRVRLCRDHRVALGNLRICRRRALGLEYAEIHDA